MSGLREESPNLREDLPAGAPAAGLTMFALAIPVAFFTAGAFALWAAIPVLIRAQRWRRAGGTPRRLLTRIGRALRP